MVALGLDPDLPGDEVQEMPLEQVQLLQGDSPDESQVVVPVEHVVVKLRCHKHCGKDQPIKMDMRDMFLFLDLKCLEVVS